MPQRLGSPHHVGRASGSHLRIEHVGCSAHHATLEWRAGHWLCSPKAGAANGTWVDGARMRTPRVFLAEGMTLGFGRPEADVVVQDVEPPMPFAVSERGEEVLFDRGRITLPLGRDVIGLGPGGRWTWHRPDGEVPVADNSVVVTDSGCWTLRLPELLPATDHATPRLRIRPDRTYETAEVDLLIGEGARRLPARRPYLMLWHLARAREEDRQKGHVDGGWRTYADLAAAEGQRDPAFAREWRRQLRVLLKGAGIAESTVVEVRSGQPVWLRLAVADAQVDDPV